MPMLLDLNTTCAVLEPPEVDSSADGDEGHLSDGVADGLAKPDVDDEAASECEPATAVSILIVEDDVTLRSLAALAFRAQGWDVVEADDGEHALALMAARERPFELVVTDVILPRLDGLELRRRVKDVPFLFITGDRELAAQADRLKDPLLPKPFRIEALLAAMRDVMEASKD